MRWFAARLSIAVYDTNREIMAENSRKQANLEWRYPWRYSKEKPMSITGADFLAQSIKDKIRIAKERASNALTRADNAFGKFDGACSQVETVSSQIEQEADGLLAELGQISNGGPA